MKTPQRKFVVEFKSPRRLSKTRTNSIWGDTDLKAFAREVEDQPSGLKRSSETRDEISAGATLPGSVDMGSANDAIVGDAVQAAKPLFESPKIELSVEAEQVEAGSVAQVQEDLLVPQPRRLSMRARRRVERGQQSTRKTEGQNARPQIVAKPVSLDEIAALDAENKRLKQQLVEHFRDQNSRLKQMLGRFELN